MNFATIDALDRAAHDIQYAMLATKIGADGGVAYVAIEGALRTVYERAVIDAVQAVNEGAAK